MGGHRHTRAHGGPPLALAAGGAPARRRRRAVRLRRRLGQPRARRTRRRRGRPGLPAAPGGSGAASDPARSRARSRRHECCAGDRGVPHPAPRRRPPVCRVVRRAPDLRLRVDDSQRHTHRAGRGVSAGADVGAGCRRPAGQVHRGLVEELIRSMLSSGAITMRSGRLHASAEHSPVPADAMPGHFPRSWPDLTAP